MDHSISRPNYAVSVLRAVSVKYVKRVKYALWACLILVITITAGSIGLAKQGSATEPASFGDLRRGKLTMPLIRGAAMQPEVTVLAPFGDCDGEIEMTVRWDEAADWVTVRLRGKRVLEPFPSIDRTPGVNFFPNPFWLESEDIVDGRYQFWFISPAGDMTFYYDSATLELLGSEFHVASPPVDAIAIKTPSVRVLGSAFFQPDADGDLDVTLTWSYHDMVRGDRPELSHHRVGFPPVSLCGSDEFRYDLSSTRGVISDARPLVDALDFSDYLRNGMFFNITVEPATYFVEPPLDTQFSTHSNATLFGGGIPRGYTWDIDASFMNLAPGIRPFEGADSCGLFFTGVHTTGLNVCGP